MRLRDALRLRLLLLVVLTVEPTCPSITAHTNSSNAGFAEMQRRMGSKSKIILESPLPAEDYYYWCSVCFLSEFHYVAISKLLLQQKGGGKKDNNEGPNTPSSAFPLEEAYSINGLFEDSTYTH